MNISVNDENYKKLVNLGIEYNFSDVNPIIEELLKSFQLLHRSV